MHRLGTLVTGKRLDRLVDNDLCVLARAHMDPDRSHQAPCEFLAAAVSWSADAVRFGLKRCSVASMCRRASRNADIETPPHSR